MLALRSPPPLGGSRARRAGASRVSVFRLVEPALPHAYGFFASILFENGPCLALRARSRSWRCRLACRAGRAGAVPAGHGHAVGPSEEVPLLVGRAGRRRGRSLRLRALRLSRPCHGPEEVPGLMRVCLMIEGQEGVTWDDGCASRKRPRSTGSRLFRSDHYTAIIRPDADAHDAWATLAGLAAMTSRIRLGTMVSPGRSGTRACSRAWRSRSTTSPVAASTSGSAPAGTSASTMRTVPVPRRKGALRALRRAGRGPCPLLDRGALRPRRACLWLRSQLALPRPLQRPHPPQFSVEPRSGGSPRSLRSTRRRSTRSAHPTRTCASARRRSTARAPRSAAIRRRSASPS